MPEIEPLRLLVVANKTWECDPLVATLLSKDARSATLSRFVRGHDPVGATAATPRPRLTFAIGAKCAVEVWCIEDWMRSGRHKSSSFEKFGYVLQQIKEHAFAGEAPDVVIGFGTAGIPSPESMNGCVTVGTRVYIHDPWLDATAEERAEQVRRFGPLLGDEIAEMRDRPLGSPQLRETLFADLGSDSRHLAEARFLRPPIEPADLPRILAGHGFASLGTINICDYDDYVWADDETLRAFETQVRQREIGSMETTHGLVRITWPNTAFLFVSGITDRVPLFNAEVTPRKYAQNFAAAHNASVVTAHLLPELARLDAADGLFVHPRARGPTKVLLVGLLPEVVDFGQFPGLTIEKLSAALAAQEAELRAKGLDARWCLVDLGATAEAVLSAALAEGGHDVVLFGAGVRTVPAHLLLFERLLNVAHFAAPRARICFNTRPDDTVEAVHRALR